MITIGVVANIQKDVEYKYTKALIKNIENYKERAQICNPSHIDIECSNENDINMLMHNSDIIICIGGDGTLLKTACRAFHSQKPILGVNLGSLGFLSEINKDEIKHVIYKILNDEYIIETRMVLSCEIIRNNEQIANDIAINDVVVSRGALSRILPLKAYFNNALVNSFPGDGIIIATPTGSTGYSLSAGGPIVEPGMDTIIVTPICPHMLYSRSFVTSSDRTVKIEVDKDYSHAATVTADGQRGYTILGGDQILVHQSKNKLKMLKLSSTNFFDILRSKIQFRK